ncbi:MAG: DNA alkylation repair protein [Prevotellaceae bacterium]|jgi:3-methyladenine DNA glycosylase AlkD|nr:DNA alkylation repair protein [Prevotellaceae bacterium]
MKNIIRKELEVIADEKYRLFSSKLIPNINNVLGVRLPQLRKIAKRLAKEGFSEYLTATDLIYFEETMLQGMIIGYLKTNWEEKAKHVAEFVPKINNWSVCDSFCTGLKFNQADKELVWKFIQPYLKSKEVYEIRFGVVMLLFHFVEEKYTKYVLRAFDKIRHGDYYVKMAVAWAVSIYYRDLPDVTMPYLKDNNMDDWTHNKAVQKITESLAIDNETKDIIRSIKRGKAK